MLQNIPAVILPIFSKPGDKILDPFCGSGTVLLESMIKGRNAIGIDINPLAVLISKVKTTPLDTQKISIMEKKIIDGIKKKKQISIHDFPNRNYWFTPASQKQLASLLSEIKKIDEEEYRNFFLVCISSCVRYASRADPEIIPPVISKKMKEIQKNRRTNVLKKFRSTVQANIRRVTKISAHNSTASVQVQLGNSRNIPLADDSINLVITSPPYISAQKYPRSLKLEMFWTELINNEQYGELERNTIGTERVSMLEKDKDTDTKIIILKKFLDQIKEKNIERYIITRKYFLEMQESINEIHRVLLPGGHFVLLIGENTVCGIKAPTAKILSEYCKEKGLEQISEIEDQIQTFGFMTRRNKTAGIIDKEIILIFKKRM